MQNNDLRETARKSNVTLWQIADKLRVSEPTMTRKLRHELPEEEKQKLLETIKQLSKEASA